MGTVSLTGSLNEGDVFEVTVKGKTFSYTATQNDTNLDQIAQKLTALVNADTTLGVTAINGIASLQLVGQTNDERFTVVSSVNGQLPELTGGFFTNADRYTFKVNAELSNGFQQLKKNAARRCGQRDQQLRTQLHRRWPQPDQRLLQGADVRIHRHREPPTPRSSATAPSSAARR